MQAIQFDVIVVGAGPAGISAAVRLGRAGLSVLVLEAGVHPGAENWSGAVYFTETLEHPELFGPSVIADAPYERRVVQRGAYLYNGHSLLGVSHRDPATFRSSYTVLRPVYDRYLAERARELGVLLACETTAQSLIRADGRVIGVMTSRGPTYADVVFLAEGDASHLTTQEGYDDRVVAEGGPHFLQGVKQVIRLPRELLEARFGLGADEGCCLELLIRNGHRHGRQRRLNMGGFLYTNRDSISLGFVLPLENLRDEWDGSHDRLLETLKQLPQVADWIRGGEEVSYGAKLIRVGAPGRLPRLVDDGLAIGGAATGIGLDFPYPNYTGPATLMGRLFAEAVIELRETGQPADAAALEALYVRRLEATSFYKSLDYLAHWPGYVERSTVFFADQLDLACGVGYCLTRPDWGAGRKLWEAVRTVRAVAPLSQWPRLAADGLQLAQALRFGRLVLHGLNPACWLSWMANLLVGWFGVRHPTGLKLTFVAANGQEASGRTPWPLRWVWRRGRGALSDCLSEVYANDGTPLGKKLARCARMVSHRVSPLDLIWAASAAVLVALVAAVQGALDRLRGGARGAWADVQAQVARATCLDDTVRLAEPMDAKLGAISYHEGHSNHIRVLWPTAIDERGGLVTSPLWSVCPARVYEQTPATPGVPAVVVNYENCIKCESCWRATGDVHWSRAGEQRLVYETYGPSSEALREVLVDREDPLPRMPEDRRGWLTRWLEPQRESLVRWAAELAPASRPAAAARVAGARRAAAAARRDIARYAEALEREPDALEPGRLDWLSRLFEARRQRVEGLLSGLEALRPMGLAGRLPLPGLFDLLRDVRAHQAREAAQMAARRPMWVALGGAQLAAHHLVAIDGVIDVLAAAFGLTPLAPPAPSQPAAPVDEALATLFDQAAVRTLDGGAPLTPAQREAIVGRLEAAWRDPAPAAAEQAVVEQLALQDPALAWVAAHAAQARRLLDRAGASGAATRLAVAVGGVTTLVPSQLAGELLVCGPGGLRRFALDDPLLAAAPAATIGLRGARPWAVTPPRDGGEPVGALTGDAWCAWVDSGAPLMAALAAGAGRYLLARAIDHAGSRVQFGRQFTDEAGTTGIGKFGAVKRLLAEIATGQWTVEALARVAGEPALLPPGVAGLVLKVAASQALGPHEGSAAYNAGQVFGGTAFAEDDLLAKIYRDSGMFRYLFGHDDALRAELARRALVDSRRGRSWLVGPTAPSLQGTLSSQGILEEPARAVEAAGRALHGIATQLAGGAQPPAARSVTEPGSDCDPSRVLLGGALVDVLGARALLVETHRALERGEPAREAVQATRMAVGRLAPAIAGLRADLRRVRAETEIGEALLAGDPPDSGPAQAGSYRDVRDAALPPSGAYLTEPFDPDRVRYVPELQSSDDDLRERLRSLGDEFRTTRREATFDGTSYAHHIEARHRLPDADVVEMHERGWLRTVIPTALGGEGMTKAQYYALIQQSMRWGDPSHALVIMGSTSIGTTPIQLGLNSDLPRLARELDGLAAAAPTLTALAADLERAAASSGPGASARAEALARAVAGQLKSSLRRQLGGGVLRGLSAAQAAQRRGDPARMAAELTRAASALRGLLTAVGEQQAELPRRERAHRLYLQLIAHGMMSAFALTEPTAGSDSGGVKTQARRERRRLLAQPDGTYRFFLDEDAQRGERRLIDADRLVFEAPADGPRRIAYRPDPDGPAYPLAFDAYDYETDAVKTRTFERDGERIAFDDIGQVRGEGDDLHWAFYTLNGAKMWITNGRWAGVMCVYAKTAEGVTGLMVDRHAEGFVVGADEEKLGQMGSPTNELSLTDVRVAAEQVIGIPGRGQVNALETLNVGRGGLAVSCVGIGLDLLHRARAHVAGLGPAASEYQRQRLGRIACELASIETLAFELVGLFDGRAREAPRVESAIAKYWTTEALHRAISHEEDLRGLPATLRDHDIEKKRRDARVLTIYEGTNEVQRFLLLKDLSGYLLARHRSGRRRLADAPPRSALPALEGRIEAAKDRLFGVLDGLERRHGAALWQVTSYQPSYFRLAEVAGWLKLCDALLYRSNRALRGSNAGDERTRRLARIAELEIARGLAAIDGCLARLAVDAPDLDADRYPPAVQLGYLLLEPSARTAPVGAPPLASVALDRVVEVLVVVTPAARVAPRPRIAGGQLREPSVGLGLADCAALAAAARLAAASPGAVRVTAVAVTGGVGREALREALARGADRVWQFPVDDRPRPVDELGAVLLDGLDRRRLTPDLVLCGDAPTVETGQSGLAAFLAAALAAEVLGGAEAVALDAGPDGLRARVTIGDRAIRLAMPAVIALTAGEALPPPGLDRLIGAADRPVEVEHAAVPEPALVVEVRPLAEVARADVARATDADAAAELFVRLAGVGAGAGAAAPPLTAAGLPFTDQDPDAEPSVLALLPGHAGNELAPEALAVAGGALRLGQARGLPVDVVLPVEPEAADLPRLAGALAALGPRRIYLLRQPDVARFSWRGLLQLFGRFLTEYAGSPRTILGTTSLEPVLAHLARRYRAPLWSGIERVDDVGGRLGLATRICGGRAEAVAMVDGTTLLVGSWAPGAVEVPPAEGDPELFVDELPLDYDLAGDPLAIPLGAVPGEASSGLTRAEYVIDVGYAVGSLDGMATVIEPLEQLLRDELGLLRTAVGATRKVTQDLKLLPADRQIGQTGVRVAPRVLIAVGVSGAPQHVDYIDKGTVILSFNRDPDAPLMQHNRDHPTPIVHPILGDLFESVPAFIEALRRRAGAARGVTERGGGRKPE